MASNPQSPRLAPGGFYCHPEYRIRSDGGCEKRGTGTSLRSEPVPFSRPCQSPKYRFQYSAPSGPGSGGLVSAA